MEVVVSQRSSGDGDVLLFAPKLDVGMYPRREQFPPTCSVLQMGGVKRMLTIVSRQMVTV